MAAALRYLIPSLCRLSVSGSASAWPEKRLHGSRVVVVRSRNTPKFLQNKLAAMFTLRRSPSASTSGRDDVNEATSKAITPPPQKIKKIKTVTNSVYSLSLIIEAVLAHGAFAK